MLHRRVVLGALLMCAAVEVRGDDSQVTAPAPPPTVQAGDLLQIDYQTGPSDNVPQRLYVRVSADGYSRFPLTEANLPFAQLEFPVVEAMLASHLQVRGVAARNVKVQLREVPLSLVTITGLVQKPGVYELPIDATLTDAIAAAGGLIDEPQPTPTVSPRSSTFDFPGGESSAPPQAAARRNVVVDVEHPTLTLGMLSSQTSQRPYARTVLFKGIPSSEFDTMRICIDGVILRVEVPAPLSKPAEDGLFMPL